MKVIPPVTLTVGTNCTTTLAEPDATLTVPEVAWAAATGYIDGNTVYRSTTHKLYKSISPTLTTDATVPETSVLTISPKWIDIGYCNARKMFDTTRADPSISTSNITLTITPVKIVNSIAFLDMTNITDLLVTGTVSGIAAYNTASTHINTTGLSQYVLWDLPSSPSLVLTIVMTGTATRSCGNVVVGFSEYLGDLQSNVTVDSINFSTIDRDTYSTATVVRRRSVPKLSYNTLLLANKVNRALTIRDSLNATPAVWCGMDDNVIPNYYNSLLVLGFYRNFSITLDNPVASTLSLELEEI
jgi:hypothetical protein